jgi:uncharacterized membrane protein YccC
MNGLQTQMHSVVPVCGNKQSMEIRLSAELREVIGGDNKVLSQARGASDDFVNAVSVYIALHDQLRGKLSDDFIYAIRPNASALNQPQARSRTGLEIHIANIC